MIPVFGLGPYKTVVRRPLGVVGLDFQQSHPRQCGIFTARLHPSHAINHIEWIFALLEAQIGQKSGVGCLIRVSQSQHTDAGDSAGAMVKNRTCFRHRKT